MLEQMLIWPWKSWGYRNRDKVSSQFRWSADDLTDIKAAIIACDF